MQSQKFIDTRTNEIVTMVPLHEIQYFEKYHGDESPTIEKVKEENFKTAGIESGKAIYDECNHGCDGPATEYVILTRILDGIQFKRWTAEEAAEAILHIKDFN